jgi:hypothetical protein
MKFKWRLWSGPTFAAVVLVWLVLAYIFMWPPVVTDYRMGPHSWDFWWNLREPRGYSSSYPCINNLRQISEAIDEWALENEKHTGDPVTLDQIKPYIKINMINADFPKCPWGGKYSVTVVGAPPTCSLETNSETARIRIDNFYWQAIPGSQHRMP